MCVGLTSEGGRLHSEFELGVLEGVPVPVEGLGLEGAPPVAAQDHHGLALGVAFFSTQSGLEILDEIRVSLLGLVNGSRKEVPNVAQGLVSLHVLS